MAKVPLDENAKRNVQRLLKYAENHLYLNQIDYLYAQNQLLDCLKLDEPGCYEADDGNLYDILSELSAYAVKKRISTENDRLNFETKLVGFVMPSPSQTVATFENDYSALGAEFACNRLFKLGEDSAYLRRPDLDKNIIWRHNNARRGDIIVTINLSKPEKTPEQVRLAKLAKGGYPKCMLCEENLGWFGNAAKPARQNIRIIPIKLDGEDWFLQYSPYQYFEQHAIAVSREHRPMKVSAATFRRMLDFVDLFPHYFIGSNAALPIVGGSILAHDHYQGGKKVLPVFERGARRTFNIPDLPNVKLSVVDWYNSIVRLESRDRDQLLKAAERFRTAWDNYSDESANIICRTEENGEVVPHNAITPIASLNDDGEYQINLILRNNRTDEAHPFGIFHPAQELHNIKQESIGIIEVMGLFILPGRLDKETAAISDILTGKTAYDPQDLMDENNMLHKHAAMIEKLVNSYGTNCTDETAKTAVVGYINDACEKILDTTAVFKNDVAGQAAFDRFINGVLEKH